MRATARLVVIALLLLGCSDRDDVTTIATIDGRVIKIEEMETHLREILGEDLYVAPTEVLSELLDQLIEEELIYRHAIRENFSKELPYEEVIRRYLLEMCEKLPGPDNEEVKQYYLTHKLQYNIKRTYVFRMILVASREEAQRIYSELKEGGSFDELAREHSISPNAGSGGLVGPVELNRLPQNIQEVLIHLKDGEVSNVVEVPYGYLIFLVIRTIPARDLSMEEVYDDIVSHLREKVCSERQAHLVESLERKETVWIYAHHLPFPYSGKYPCWQ